MDSQKNKIRKSVNEISRRKFLKYSGCAVAGTVVMGTGFMGCDEREGVEGKIRTELLMTAEERDKISASDGYILIDSKKCMGCVTCMLGCSLVHEGEVNLSLSRIQVMQNSFGKFPEDISIMQCRQCIEPACVEACPTEALHIDTDNGNVRIVDKEKCIGCMSCVEECAYEPSMAIWNFEEENAVKCDLCLNTPHWKEKGGPGGKQACVELCPVGAIKFTGNVPVQKGDVGYNVNLRDESWKKLGYIT